MRLDIGAVDGNESKVGLSAQPLEKELPNLLSRQREKRRWVFFQSPYWGGKSRHGAPS